MYNVTMVTKLDGKRIETTVGSAIAYHKQAWEIAQELALLDGKERSLLHPGVRYFVQECILKDSFGDLCDGHQVCVDNLRKPVCYFIVCR